VRSPDNPYLVPPGAPAMMKFEVKRSKGFEGMAASPDGKFLYPLLEGPSWVEATNSFESKDGKTYLRILEFDVDKAAFTGKSWKYQLELPANAIGDFNLIDATSGLIIERDDSEGDPAQACLEGAPKPDCFNVPAKFKRIYKIDFAQADGQPIAGYRVALGAGREAPRLRRVAGGACAAGRRGSALRQQAAPRQCRRRVSGARPRAKSAGGGATITIQEKMYRGIWSDAMHIFVPSIGFIPPSDRYQVNGCVARGVTRH
jgi:hypothetical protein